MLYVNAQIVKSVGPGDGLIDWSGDVLLEAEVLMSLETSPEKVQVKTGGQTSIVRDFNEGNSWFLVVPIKFSAGLLPSWLGCL